MKPVILVIGIKDSRVVTDAYLSVNGVKTEENSCLIHTLLGEFETMEEAHQTFMKIDNYDYLEIKTVYKKQ